jgi:hypothetical protein
MACPSSLNQRNGEPCARKVPRRCAADHTASYDDDVERSVPVPCHLGFVCFVCTFIFIFILESEYELIVVEFWGGCWRGVSAS